MAAATPSPRHHTPRLRNEALVTGVTCFSEVCRIAPWLQTLRYDPLPGATQATYRPSCSPSTQRAWRFCDEFTEPRTTSRRKSLTRLTCVPPGKEDYAASLRTSSARHRGVFEVDQPGCCIAFGSKLCTDPEKDLIMGIERGHRRWVPRTGVLSRLDRPSVVNT
jgi:hypothetical protein